MNRYFPTHLAALLLAALLCFGGALFTGCRSQLPAAPAAPNSAPFLVKADSARHRPAAGPDSDTPAPRRTDFAPTRGGERRFISALRAVNPAHKVKRGAVLVVAPQARTVDVTAATGKRANVAEPGGMIATGRGPVAQAGPGATISQTVTPAPGLLGGLKTTLMQTAAGVASLMLLVLFLRKMRAGDEDEKAA